MDIRILYKITRVALPYFILETPPLALLLAEGQELV
jgi:hypothetical protein